MNNEDKKRRVFVRSMQELGVDILKDGYIIAMVVIEGDNIFLDFTIGWDIIGVSIDKELLLGPPCFNSLDGLKNACVEYRRKHLHDSYVDWSSAAIFMVDMAGSLFIEFIGE